MDKTILKVKRYIEEEHLIKKGDKIILGVSGGADSVCLLSILNSLKKEFYLELEVVHINHMIRKDANEDALYVTKLCKRYDIPFHLFEEDVEKLAKEYHISTEDAGRKVRYEAFNKIAGNNAKIAVAHNKNDKVETFFFNLFRGAGINGLCSIKNKRENIIRPILCLERNEIEEYLNRIGLDFKIDSTNNTTLYTRNKIRNKVIPYVKEEIHSNIIGNVSNTIELMEEVNDFFNDYVENYCKKNVKFQEGNVVIDLDIFSKEKIIIKKLVILKALEYFIPSKKDISSKNIEDILDICNKNGRKEIFLLNNLKVVKNFGLLSIHYGDYIPKIEILEGNSKILKTNEGNFEFNVIDFNLISLDNIINSNNKDIKCFDLDLISMECFSIDYIKETDYIYLNDSRKNLKDYFNGEKIKGNTPVFSCNGNVLWVVGYRIGDFYKVTENTKKILVIKKI